MRGDGSGFNMLMLLIISKMRINAMFTSWQHPQESDCSR